MHPIRNRLWLAVTTRPKRRDWIELGIAAGVFGGCAAFAGRDLITPQLLSLSAALGAVATALFIPTMTEELVFRGLMMPGRGEKSPVALWLAASTILFVLWHILEALTFLPGAAGLFLRADFLCLAALLGGLCGILRWRSGSLWTAVVLHGIVVIVWKVALGGPSLADLTAP